MAVVDKTVQLIFQGDDRVSGTLKSISGGLGSLESGIEAVAAPLAAVADAVLAADAAAATLAATLLAVSVNEAGKFNDSFREISTLVDASDAELAAFKSDLLDYSRTSTSAFADINEATYQAISLGINYKDAVEALTAAEKLSTAGKADLSSTIELLVGTLNAYGTGVGEAERYSDAFFTTVRLGKTTIPELAENLGKVATDAALAKVPIETLLAAVAGLTAANLNTATATTALRAVIKSIVDPSDQAAAAAESMGIEFSGAALASKGLDGIMREVAEATGGNVDELKKLFDNVRAYTGASVLAIDASGKFAEALGAMETKAGATDRAFARMADSFANANTKLVNNLKATLVEIGTPLLDEYGELAKQLGRIFEGVSIGLDAGAFDPLFAALEKLGVDVAAFFEGFADALPQALANVNFEGLVEALQGLGDAILSAFSIDLTKPQDLASSIQFVVDGLTLLANVTSGMVGVFAPLIEDLKNLLDIFIKLPPEIQTGLIGRLLGAGKVVDELGAKLTAATIVAGSFASESSSVGQSVGALGTLFGFLTGDVELSAVAFNHMVKATGGALGLPDVEKAAAGARAEFGALEIATGSLENEIDFLAKRNEDARTSFDNQKSSIEDLRTTVDTFRDSLKNKLGVALNEAVDDLDELGTSSAGLDSNFGSLEKSAGAVKREAEGLDQSLPSVVFTMEDLEEAARLTGVAEDGLAAQTDKAKTSLEDASDASEAYRLALRKIDAELRDKELELAYDLQVEKVNADARQVVAAFEAISSTVESTGGHITELYELLTNAEAEGSTGLVTNLRNAILTEEKRREQAFKKEQELVQARIDSLNAQALRASQGSGIIQVDTTGVEPALEAVLWTILEKVQLRVNEAAGDFLLGIGG